MGSKVFVSSCVLLLIFACQFHSGNSLNATELSDLISDHVEQMRSQVHANRGPISESTRDAFKGAVQLVDGYQKFVFAEYEKLKVLLDKAKMKCIESLPKSEYAILKAADWSIEMCIGHMSVYGMLHSEEAEMKLQSFDLHVSQYPIQAIKDYFLSDDWPTEDGVEAIIDLLMQRMLHWDNVQAVDLFQLRNAAKEEFATLSSSWTVCVNYGRGEMKKLFEEAAEHIEECGK